MIQKVVEKHHLQERVATQNDVAYWLSQTPNDRVATVYYLFKQYYGDSARLQRVARIVQRASR